MLESCARAGLGGGISVLPTLPIAAGVAAGVLVAKPLIGWATPRVVAAAAFLRACLFGNSARAAECHDPPTISLILTLAPVTAVPGREAATHTPFNFRRFIEICVEKWERNSAHDRLAAALADGSHEWEFSDRSRTATLAGVSIRFGKAKEQFRLFKVFARLGCRTTVGHLLPNGSISNEDLDLAAGCLHQNINRLSARLEAQVGYEISAERVHDVSIYSLRPVGLPGSRRRSSRQASAC